VARRLTIRTKLAAALAAPLVALATFAAFQVQDASGHAGQVKHQAALAIASSGPAGVLTALENERAYATLWDVGKQDQLGKILNLPDVTSATGLTNSQLGTFRGLLHDVGGGGAAANYTKILDDVSNKLTQLRHDAQNDASKAATPATARTANQIFDRYSALIDKLLDADQQSAASINDAQLRNGADLLNAMARQNDVENQIAIRSILATVSHDPAIVLDVQRLDGQQIAGIADVVQRGRVDPYETAVLVPLTTKSKKLSRADVQKQLDTIAADPQHVDFAAVLTLVGDATRVWHGPQGSTASVLQARAQQLNIAAQNQQRNWKIIAVGAILLAVVVLWLSNKWITRPLRALATQAAAMAGERLPAAVKQTLETPLTEEVTRPDVAPIKVRAGGEVREVESALNAVQDSALTLAVEQASLRRNVADAYVNLGRRNQNLLSRQLEFISQLEKDESDPDRLDHLFKLDHLATRMRRNAESLLVLAGHEAPRTWSAPVALVDVVRGALGEVEGYQRVRLRHIDDAQVDGAAAADVSHVIAELVENALSFSPPTADVEIYGRLDGYGYVLTIVDSGIGMQPTELERANALITTSSALTLSPSKFLGHYVVGQLAARHGLQVHLAASPTGGLTAMIGLSPEVLGGHAASADVPVAPDPTDLNDDERPALVRRESGAHAATPAPQPMLDLEAPPPAPDVTAPPVPPAPAPAPFVIPEPAAFAAPPAPPAPEPMVAPAPEPVVAPAPEPMVAPAPEPVVVPEPEPEPEPFVAPPVAAALEAPTVVEPDPEAVRRRLGFGSFADLRAAPAPPRAPQPAPEPVADVPPAPDAPDAPPTHPAVDAPQPDRHASFAEVARAVDDAATGHTPALPPTEAASNGSDGTDLSEDFLPSRLPKRGRRASRLQTPWARERPAGGFGTTAADAPSAFGVAPAVAAAPSSNGTGTGTGTGNGALRFAAADNQLASSPASHEPGVGEPEPASPPAPAGAAPNGESDERFAFFAAFRAAAERAREEAGIDDRRVGH